MSVRFARDSIVRRIVMSQKKIAITVIGGKVGFPGRDQLETVTLLGRGPSPRPETGNAQSSYKNDVLIFFSIFFIFLLKIIFPSRRRF